MRYYFVTVSTLGAFQRENTIPTRRLEEPKNFSHSLVSTKELDPRLPSSVFLSYSAMMAEGLFLAEEQVTKHLRWF